MEVVCGGKFALTLGIILCIGFGTGFALALDFGFRSLVGSVLLHSFVLGDRIGFLSGKRW